MVEYLELFKGDDTDFSLNQAICIKLVTDYDLAGCTAHVKFYDYEQTFYPIVDKKLPLSFPGSVTSKFPLGRGSAKIWLTEPDPEGSGTRRRTVANDLKILVTNNIDLLSRKDISYTMILRYDYKDLDSKPMLNGKVIEGDHTDDYYGIKGPKPDTELSEESENAVQNKVIAGKFKEMDETVSAEVSRATTEEARLQELINAIKTFDAVFADSLPSPSEQYSKKLYLVPSTNPEAQNVKDEFICVKIKDSWSWEQVGSPAITIEFDDEPTEGSQKAAMSGGIWSWVKSLLPKWLTSDYAEPATVASVKLKADKATTLAGYGITDAVPFVEDAKNKTAVTIGSRTGNVGANSLANGVSVFASGDNSHAEGFRTTASGDYSHAEGHDSTAFGDYSHAEGVSTTASGIYSHAEGYLAYTKKQDHYAFAWNGDITRTTPYESNGSGTFNINPAGGLNGFYIGEQTLPQVINTAIAGKANLASLALEYSATSAYSVGAIVYHDGSIYQCKTAIADGGETWNVEHWELRKLDDFFTESNSLLTGTIDDRLPIPISAKLAGFTTESYKRFIVTVSGDMTVTLHTPTSGDAEIFECRFNGESLAADASITFVGATATTMDTDCGTVKAGKVALMSAFWNGTTWDVNWKVEG